HHGAAGGRDPLPTGRLPLHARRRDQERGDRGGQNPPLLGGAPIEMGAPKWPPSPQRSGRPGEAVTPLYTARRLSSCSGSNRPRLWSSPLPGIVRKAAFG